MITPTFESYYAGPGAPAPAGARAPAADGARAMPAGPRQLFVNIPVADLQQSIAFFTTLGFAFNARFTDESTTCMLVGRDAYFMLMEAGRFRTFTNHPPADVRQTTTALYAIGVGTRAEVEAIVHAAVANGGAPALEAQDHGFMYAWSFYDPDGHHWEVLWMDPGYRA